jgi:hypothetical protein
MKYQPFLLAFSLKPVPHPGFEAARKNGCVECGARKVLRVVGRKGYCGAHTAEAFAAARRGRVLTPEMLEGNHECDT